ncbi:Elongation of fatty acids protein 2 [Wickerhamiella sorbophila]|uniref:Elongation of fatty acids protein n=1 Tax=Wickerhamiella sorbophila TaxID=45607 RepID=A0A2T0FNS5_9ASCO|nr:Elongation of fatty acids protein 2 [Wickerhamiella sorbophila]PRT56609.1 Elongation of fatty acids protein 2 [Wickerhamiella sorbophila]
MAEEIIENVEHLVTESLPFTGGSSCLEYGMPTLDRPFGVALWPLFVEGTRRVTGWDLSKFDYEYNSWAPMSKVHEVLIAITMYYVVIFGGRWALQNVRPIKFGFIFKLHNLLLTFFSLTLLILMIEQLVPILVRHGIFYAICNTTAWTQPLVTLYYLNYLTKYYELLDTCFLVLRKRPLTFLHTYHHGATALLCFNQLNGSTSISWVPISLNLFVHVVMYFYYFLSACGIRPWWKHWVTRVQIIQFIIDLAFVYFASYTHFVYRYFPNLPNKGRCAGEESAAVNGCLILTSYLVLFVSFYIKVYLAPKKTKKVSSESAADKPASAKASGAAASDASRRSTRSRRI